MEKIMLADYPLIFSISQHRFMHCFCLMCSVIIWVLSQCNAYSGYLIRNSITLCCQVNYSPFDGKSLPEATWTHLAQLTSLLKSVYAMGYQAFDCYGAGQGLHHDVCLGSWVAQISPAVDKFVPFKRIKISRICYGNRKGI